MLRTKRMVPVSRWVIEHMINLVTGRPTWQSLMYKGLQSTYSLMCCMALRPNVFQEYHYPLSYLRNRSSQVVLSTYNYKWYIYMICQHSVGGANALGKSQCLNLLVESTFFTLGQDSVGLPSAVSNITSWGNRTKHHLH